MTTTNRGTQETGRIPIRDVGPVEACGRWAAKAVVGESFAVTATIFREGHDALGANVVLRGPKGAAKSPWTPMVPYGSEPDRWTADVSASSPGEWTFQVEAWSDPIATWLHDARIKLPADLDVELMSEEGARLFVRAAGALPKSPTRAEDAALLTDVAAVLRDSTATVSDRLAAADHADVAALLARHPLRELVTTSARHRLRVERARALVGSWYEFFPRSEGAVVDPTGVEAPRSGTFRTAMDRLPAIADMGFEVVYLPPIHPIGKTFRKGPNNTLTPGPHDPGVPWAIGSAAGGHDAIHPDLGTMDDFDAFVGRAGELGLEVALDYALQASPDHPWVKEHPDWFTERADGTIAYAENPPKKYQDIYPLNFDRDYAGLYEEARRILHLWMSHGVRIFRVDNPHTKPVHFWEELLADIRSTDPDVIFLAEAFTRPAMMRQLAAIGFQQSYTYFTWRTEKWELEQYFNQLAHETAHIFRPNCFVNTPDILHASLQYGGPPMFKIRATLAATLSPTWGVYSGYELVEHVAVRPGSEEYLDSEKYAYRPRDWARAEAEGWSLAPYLTTLNRIRSEHPALQLLRNLTFHHSDDEHVMAYSKRRGDDVVICVVNLDPHGARETTVRLDMPSLGLEWWDHFAAHDEISGQTFTWGQDNYVRLDPFVEPAHVLVVQPLHGGPR